MASAATRHSLIFFNGLNYCPPQRLMKLPLHLTCSKSRFTNINIPTTNCTTGYNSNISIKSIDVSKEDKQQEQEQKQEEEEQSAPISEENKMFDKRRLEEKFAVVNTGIYECRSCGFKYDEVIGDASYPIPPGLPFNKLPDDWRCPTCGASQSFFESKSKEIAGFAENQQFGFGANTLTSGQKALLIYGSLFFAFVLFLSGYFLQ